MHNLQSKVSKFSGGGPPIKSLSGQSSQPNVPPSISASAYRPWHCCLWPMNLTTLHVSSNFGQSMEKWVFLLLLSIP